MRSWSAAVVMACSLIPESYMRWIRFTTTASCEPGQAYLTPAMLIPHLHDWPATEAEALELQAVLAARVDVSRPLTSFELVAGCDVAYHLTEPVLFAAVVVVRIADRVVIETHTANTAVNFPYVPGLLSFREIPALLLALSDLRSTPNAVMLDGQGIAHPRRFGLASHLG